MTVTIIGEVSESWEQTTLGELCERGNGSIQTGPFGSQLHASDYVERGVPSVMPKDIGENRIRRDALSMISEDDADRLSRYRMQPGDIVYSRRGDVERRALITEAEAGWLCGTGCLRVRLGSSAVPAYVSYFLGHPAVRSWIVQHAVGATMANLNTEILGAVPVVVPPRPTQVRVAEVLGALDAKIDVNQRVAQGAEDLAVSKLAVAADDVEWVELGEIAEHQKTSVDPATIDGDVDHFSIPAFDAARLPVREPGTAIKSNKLSVPDRTVLVSRLNPRIPRVWFARTTEGVPAVCSTEFLVLRPKGDLTEGELYAACSQPAVLADMARRAGGTSGSHQRIKPADALSVPVPDPKSGPLRAMLTPLLETAAHARAESATLTELRDTLLPKLLSGELRVGDAEDESEEAGV